MITTVIICGAVLFAQQQAHRHQERLKAGRGRLQELAHRIAILEDQRTQEFDPTAFEELKTKVDALRIAQGMRVSR